MLPIQLFRTIVLSTSLAIVPDASLNLFIFEKIQSSILNNRRKKAIFQDKRIWITGASSGIGKEIAKELHDYGAKLILSGRRISELERISRELRTSSCSRDDHNNSVKQNVEILPFDVSKSDEKELSNIVKNAIELYDGVDILVLNAGIGQLSPAIEETMDNTKDLMDVNFNGPVRLTMEVMKQDHWGKSPNNEEELKKGHIVYTSSVAAKLPIPLGTSYAASKYASHGYFSSLRSECQPWLRVDLPCPGPIKTEFQSKALEQYNRDKEKSDISKSDNSNDSSSEVSMSAQRCARLIVAGMSGPKILMQESWISKQPTLFFLYLNQYFPTLANVIFGIVGSLRLKAFKAGLPLYKVSSWIKVLKSKEKQ